MRDSHAHLDGIQVEYNEKFPNGLMYPADPQGAPSEVYNCRCTLIADVLGMRGKRTSNTVESYEKWLKSKEGLSAGQGKHSSTGQSVYLGKIDVSDTKKVYEYLSKKENEYINNDYETACVVLSNGDIYEVKGDKSTVDIYSIGGSLENSFMYHNHPKNETNFSFSADDLGIFLGNKARYSKASDYKYEYYMNRTKDTKDVSFSEAYHEFGVASYSNEIVSKLANHEINPDEEWFHEIMKNLSKKYHFKYVRKLKVNE